MVVSQVSTQTLNVSVTKTTQFYSEETKAAYLRVTSRLAQESKYYFGEGAVPVFSIVRIIRRPFSDVIQCTVQFDKNSFGLYIKFALVKKNVDGDRERILKNVNREVEVTKQFSAFFSKEPSVSVPEIIAFFPDDMAIVTKEKEGVPLMTLIMESGKGKPSTQKLDLLKNTCSLVGNSLKVFQKMPLINTGKDELPSNLVSYVDLRLKLLLEAGCIQMKERFNVVTYLENQIGKIEGQPLDFCGVHGDLSLGNVLIASNQVVFLDLGMYRKGPACFDLAYFHQHLDDFLTNPFFFSATIAHLQDAFFEGYQEKSIRESPLFLSYYVLKIVNHLLALSRMKKLSLLKKVYQKWQYRHCLSHLNKIIQEN